MQEKSIAQFWDCTTVLGLLGCGLHLYTVWGGGNHIVSFILSGVYYSTPRVGSFAGGTRVTIIGQGTIDFLMTVK